MPARKGSKQFNHHHSFLGQSSKNMKKISVNDLKIQEQCKLITEQEKELHNLQIRAKKLKLSKLNLK